MHPTKNPTGGFINDGWFERWGIKLYQVVDVVAWDEYFWGGNTHTHTYTNIFVGVIIVGKMMFLVSAAGAMFYSPLEHTSYGSKTPEKAVCIAFCFVVFGYYG